jgi:hypothetical protein
MNADLHTSQNSSSLQCSPGLFTLPNKDCAPCPAGTYYEEDTQQTTVAAACKKVSNTCKIFVQDLHTGWLSDIMVCSSISICHKWMTIACVQSCMQTLHAEYTLNGHWWRTMPWHIHQCIDLLKANHERFIESQHTKHEQSLEVVLTYKPSLEIVLT